MKNIQSFIESKSRLFAAYERVLASDLLPIGYLTPALVEEKRESLREERFIVAVCGQMKAGKSTLLNALVFGREVLPADDTPMTAKVTSLRYGEREGFEVTFYDDAEWREVRQDAEATEGLKASFDEQLDAALRAGESIAKNIGRAPRKLEGYEELGRFVAVPREGGVCTPYVKSITVFHTNESLRGVDVVDTPGVNDPNRVRDRETKAWIHNASAVVFVSYAGQAMSKPDIDFLDAFVLGVPSTRRVIAVNKVDAAADRAGVEAWVEKLRRHSDARIRNVMGAPELTVYVSGYGAMLAALIESGASLSAEQDEMAEILRRTSSGLDYLQPENHNLARLRALIEERLIANKGQGLIEEHDSFLRSIIERRRRAIEVELSEHTELQELAEQDKNELVVSRHRLEEQTVAIQDAVERLRADFRELSERAVQSLKEGVLAVKGDVVRCFNSRLSSITNTSNFKHDAIWALQDCFEKQDGVFFRVIKQAQAEIALGIESRMGSLNAEIVELDVFSEARVRALLDVGAGEALEGVREHFHEVLTTTRVNAIVKEATYAWQRWWDTNDGLDKARAAIRDEVRRLLEGQLKQIQERIRDSVRTRMDKLTEDARKSLNQAIEVRRREIERLLENEVGHAREIERQRASIERLKTARSELKHLGTNLMRTTEV